jgi:signal transduction histidine kinase
VNTRTFFVRVFVGMATLFAVGGVIIASISYEFRDVQTDFANANKQFIELSKDREALAQLILLGEPLPAYLIDSFAQRPLPYGCCRSEQSMYVSAVSDLSLGDRAAVDQYRISESWEQLVRAMQQALASASADMERSQALSNIVVPLLAILLFIVSVLFSFLFVNKRLLRPLEKLTAFVLHLMRGGEPALSGLDGAVSEVKFLRDSFGTMVTDYRSHLKSSGQRTLAVTQTSDASDIQIQTLIEMADRPALILDATGAVRYWNRQMVAITGIGKSSAGRLIFSTEFLAGASREIFEDAFQTARSGRIPNEFRCLLSLRGGRTIKLQVQLSPQVESGLGVNRVLAVLLVEKEDLPTETILQVDKPLASSVFNVELSLSTRWLQYPDTRVTEKEIRRQHKALKTAIDWVGRESYLCDTTDLNLTELLEYFGGTLEPRLLDLDLLLEVNLSASPVMVSADAGRLIEVLTSLTDNAIEATIDHPVNDRVISLAQGDDESGFAVLKVRDSGVGVPLELKKQIFEPFYTSKSGSGHIGLGLTHARDVIRSMSGQLEVSPDSHDLGRVLVLRLPLAHGPEHK